MQIYYLPFPFAVHSRLLFFICLYKALQKPNTCMCRSTLCHLMNGEIWCHLSHSLLYNLYAPGYPRNWRALLLLTGCWKGSISVEQRTLVQFDLSKPPGYLANHISSSGKKCSFALEPIGSECYNECQENVLWHGSEIAVGLSEKVSRGGRKPSCIWGAEKAYMGAPREECRVPSSNQRHQLCCS